ncbi:hypothetical protein SprV_0401431100 [Sparganum proliferum]
MFSSYTPPRSPRFDEEGGEHLVHSFSQEFCELDDFAEFNGLDDDCNLSKPSSLEKALRSYLAVDLKVPFADFPENFSLLWSVIARLNSPKGEPSTRASTNGLLLSIYASFKLLKPESVPLFFQRFLCLLKALDCMHNASTNLPLSTRRLVAHCTLDAWAMFLKTIEFAPSDFRAYLGEALELEPKSADPLEYVTGVLFDRLICAECPESLLSEQRSVSCECSSILWILLIRYGEKASGGWFKYLHRKMMRIRSGKLSETTGCLDELRPRCPLVTPSGVVDIEKLWQMYWNILVVSAPLHQLLTTSFSDFAVTTATSSTLKFATVVWLVRTQFLGDSTPNESSSRQALLSILKLTHTWGPSIDVERSLWLYFSRKLDSKMNLDRDSYDAESYATKLQAIRLPEVHASGTYDLFCRLTRLVFPLHPSEMFSMFRTALSSLTRLGVCNYFLLLGHLVHSICIRTSPQTPSALNDFVQFVSSLFSLRGGLTTMPDGAETKWWLDWEIGRRCAAIEGLQLLLLLVLKTAVDLSGLEEAVKKLVDLSSRFRRALLTCVQMSLDGPQTKAQGPTQSASSGKLTGLGWRSELISRSLDFCECLLWPSPDSGLEADTDRALAYLDSSVLEVILAADNHASTSFLLRLLKGPALQSAGDNPDLSGKSSTSPSSPLNDPDDGDADSLSQDYAEMAVLLTLFSASSSALRNPAESPMKLYSSFALRPSCSFGFRGRYLRYLFGDPNHFSRLYASLAPQSDDAPLSSDSAWSLFVGWLLYRLLYCYSQDTESQPRVVSLLASRFPPDLVDVVSSVDPDLALLRLCHRLDTLKSFHERMAYRETAHKHLLSLVSVLCAALDSNLLAELSKEDVRSQLLPVFGAAGTLVQTCASLLYPSPVPCQTSAFERLVSGLLLAPRRLFEQSASSPFVSGHGRVAAHPASTLVDTFRECIGEHLPQFLGGFAQLGYEKDSYLVRLLRDLLVFAYRRIGVSWLASAVLVSPTAAFRAHVLRVLSEDVVDLFKGDSNTAATAGQQSARGTGQLSVERARKLCDGWLEFLRLMTEGTQTPCQRLRDAPYLLFPLASFLGSPVLSDVSRLRTRCSASFELFVADWNGGCDEETRKLVPGVIRQVLRTASQDIRVVFTSGLQSCDGIFQS